MEFENDPQSYGKLRIDENHGILLPLEQKL